MDTTVSDGLVAAGLATDAVNEWISAEPARTADLATDRHRYSTFWERSSELIGALPSKPSRTDAETTAAALILSAGRESRERFLSAHAEAVYEELTDRRRRHVRLEDLVYAAAAAIPGLTPSEEQVAAEAKRHQSEKDGVEIDQGIFLAQTLAVEEAGLHLCHAMLLPRPESAEHLDRFVTDGSLDLGPVSLRREGKVVHLTAKNPRFLNAEDDSTLDLMETAVDVAILDPESEIAIVRGGAVDHPKYQGRRILGSGINLTHLYQGRIPFVWFLKRDLGYVHKLLRGVARGDSLPDDVRGRGIEKPWVAVVDTFAIGGHCQLLLAVDYVLAADDAFMTLPARKEGIIPGFANLRLPRMTGDRIAREAIQYERKLVCDSQEGRLICDEVASADDMDAAIGRVAAGLTDGGVVSAVGNRRAFRIGEEPLDLFRRYASVYSREQAYCHFSPALIANLERNWDAKNRKV